jgi:hypothetical protein
MDCHVIRSISLESNPISDKYFDCVPVLIKFDIFLKLLFKHCFLAKFLLRKSRIIVNRLLFNRYKKIKK